METNLLDRMLDTYLTEQSPVTITLQNKVRVSGKVRAFDSYVIIMECHKREEIVYRHAVSCLSPFVHEEQKRVQVPVPPRPLAVVPPAAKPVKPAPERPKPAQQPRQTVSASGEPSLNNSMKDGLLRWMQEQKAAK